MSLKETWHVDKSISAGHMISTVAMIFAGVLFVTDIKEDVSILAEKTENNKEHINRLDEREAKDMQNVTEELKNLRDELQERDVRIEDKLDRLIDRELNR